MRGGVTGSSPVVSIAQYVDVTNSKRRAQIGSEWRLRQAVVKLLPCTISRENYTRKESG